MKITIIGGSCRTIMTGAQTIATKLGITFCALHEKRVADAEKVGHNKGAMFRVTRCAIRSRSMRCWVRYSKALDRA